MKSFVIHQISDWEKLKQLIRVLGEDGHFQKDWVRREQVRFFTLVAEVFQYQIIEYLPAIFAVLLGKIDGEKNAEVLGSIAETVQMVFYHCFRSSEYAVEYRSVLTEILEKLFDMITRGDKDGQAGAALVILKILQLDNIEGFELIYQQSSKAILDAIVRGGGRVVTTLLECMLFLNKTFPKTGSQNAYRVASVMLDLVQHESAKVRKTAIDNLFLLTVLHGDEIEQLISQIYDAADEAKLDKDKRVRESAINCLKAIRTLEGGQLHEARKSEVKQLSKAAREADTKAQDRKSKIPDRKSNVKKGRDSSGPAIKEEARARGGEVHKGVVDSMERNSPHYFEAHKSHSYVQAHNPHQGPFRKSSVDKLENHDKKSRAERVPLREQDISSAFKKNTKEGVAIYLSYPANNNGEMIDQEENESYEDANSNIQYDSTNIKIHDEIEVGLDQGIVQQSKTPSHADTSSIGQLSGQTFGAQNSQNLMPPQVPEIKHVPRKMNIMDNAEKTPISPKTIPTRDRNFTTDTDAVEEGEYLGFNSTSNLDENLPEGDEEDDGQDSNPDINTTEMEYRPSSHVRRTSRARPSDRINRDMIPTSARDRDERAILQDDYRQQHEDFQNKRIEELTNHVQWLTSNLTSLEQSVTRLNQQQQQSGSGLPYFRYPAMQSVSQVPSQPVSSTFGATFASPMNLMQSSSSPRVTQQSDLTALKKEIEDTHKELSQWRQQRREEEERLRDKRRRVERERHERAQVIAETNRRPSLTGKITGERSARQPHVTRDTMAEIETFARTSAIISDEERAKHIKQRATKAMNLTLGRILKENEYRRLLDFLSDKDNLQNYQFIEESNKKALVEKITDMLSYKAEAYIQECIPWIQKLINTQGIFSPGAAEDMHYVIRSVLGADRKRKTYQNKTVESLESLLNNLDSVINQRVFN